MDCNNDDKCGNCGQPHSAHHKPGTVTCSRYRVWCGNEECPHSAPVADLNCPGGQSWSKHNRNQCACFENADEEA